MVAGDHAAPRATSVRRTLCYGDKIRRYILSCADLCWLLRLSVRKMTGVLYLEHPLAHKGSHVAPSVNHYFKLPGGNKWKCTQWGESVKLGQEILAHTSEHRFS